YTHFFSYAYGAHLRLDSFPTRRSSDLFVGFIDGDSSRLLTWHQTPVDPPNLFLRELRGAVPAAADGEAVVASEAIQLTRFPDPRSEERRVGKEGRVRVPATEDAKSVYV